MVSAYETASKAPSLEVLIRLSRVLGVTVDYLVCVDAPRYMDISALDDSSAALVIALVDKLAQPQYAIHIIPYIITHFQCPAIIFS